MLSSLYIPDFPAWALAHRHLGQRRIAVHEKGKIIARSRTLRRMGLENGDTLLRAEATYPKALFLPRDILYEEVRWAYLLERLYTRTPLIEPVRTGHAFFGHLSPQSPSKIADAFGVQVGVGPNRPIAHIASVRTNTGHALEVAAKGVTSFLRSTKTTTLLDLDFPDEVVERLELFGLRNLESVRTLTRRHLVVQFGDEGDRLDTLLHATDQSLQIGHYMPAPIITRELEFEWDTREPRDLHEALAVLIDEAVQRLNGFESARLILEYVDRKAQPVGYSTAYLKRPTANHDILTRAAKRALTKNWPDQPIKTFRFTLCALRTPTPIQSQLFHRRPEVLFAIKDVNERFPNAILRILQFDSRMPMEEEDGNVMVPHVT